MRFTSQEEYGLRCLFQIARDPQGALTIPEIAEREALTPAYVAKLMRVLRKAGLVKSTRGQKGGYRLVSPPEQMNVGAVLAALGGRLYSQDFCERHAGMGRVCVHDTHNVDCAIRSLWINLDSVVQRALSQTMLTDLMRSVPDTGIPIELHLDVASALQAAPFPGAV